LLGFLLPDHCFTAALEQWFYSDMHSDSAQCGTVYAAHTNKISNQTLQWTALAKPAPWVIDDMMPKKSRNWQLECSWSLKTFKPNDDAF
jgi:hypothetical protein